ncbi:MAG: sulfatase-like hydrolase/transferase [Verrucomicrobia bacterium]|nr:sulfatase-like hydrolase/transferase [Kiritimatiellia bacterium]MCP5488130.1 sulfatase-like hydrolase/transferase [Verrucomicrobiota bacterium]
MAMKSMMRAVLATWFGLQLSVVAGEKPNIVVIYADDIGYGDFGCYGGTGAATPQVDRLAEAGRRFLSAYATTATCTPSRYSLLTGSYAFRERDVEILPGNAPLIIDPSRPTLASFLRDQGYATALVGKWHLGLGKAGTPLDWNQEIAPGPRELGFDYAFHMAATADRVPSVYIENGRVVGLNPDDPLRVSYEEPFGNEPTGISHPELLRWPADEQHAGTIINGISRIGFMSGGHAARFRDEDMLDTYIGKAVAFIEQNQERPFFLYLALSENHVPRAVHERFQGTSGLGPRGDALVAFDWAVGHMVEVLKAQGVYEDTLLIVSSDNGPVLFDGYLDEAITRNGDHKPAGPYRGGKYSRWEGGTRVPFIVSWPGRVRSGVSEATVSQVDLFASFAALIGVPLPPGAAPDSRDLLPALLGESDHGREYVIEEAWKQIAIRKGDWKYLPPGTVSDRGGIGEWHYTKIEEPGFLFNLEEDPGETVNVAAQHPEMVAELRAALEQERAATPTPQSQDEAAMTVDKWLAPVRAISDITCTPPKDIQFSRIDQDVFRLTGAMPNRQTTVILRPKVGAWDLSDVSYLRVDLVNQGPGLVWIRGRLDNPGAQDWWNSTASEAFLLPGETGTLGFAYARAPNLNDAPSIFDRQSAKPNGHRTHWKAFDPAHVVACRLVIQSTSPELSLDRIAIRAGQPYGAEANKELLELPYLDRFGQVRKLDWPGKLHEEGELRRRDDQERAAEANDLGPRSFNRYGGWADGPRLEATGFFRTEKVDGKWWLVDPEGRLFFSHGMNSIGFDQSTPVEGREALFAWLPQSDDPLYSDVLRKGRAFFLAGNLARTFGADWQAPARDRVHRRLREWGMNSLGAWSDKGLVTDKRTPYTAILHAGGDWSPLGHGISDPFEQNFKQRLVEGLGKIMPEGSDRWCVGVFIDNEIDWTEKFVHTTFTRPANQPARLACLDWLKDRYGAVEKLNTAWKTTFDAWESIGALPDDETEAMAKDITDLKRLISGTYYRTCREAMREALPGQLYLGSRMHKAPREVMEEAAKYVDVLSLNSYEPLSGTKMPGGLDVPCMDTEFHFAAPDRGVPGTGMWPIGNQKQRARAYVAYVMSGVLHPNVVGTHWFAFADQSAAGRPGENHQIGFVDVTDTPYPEITRASRLLAERMYTIGTDASATLLGTLEALWRNEKETVHDMTLPYRIETSHGVEVTEADGRHTATGRGPFHLVLAPPDGGIWDMSGISVLGVTLKNTGESELVLELMARNEGATDWSDSAPGRTIVKPGEELPLGVALYRRSDYQKTDPAYLRMSGLPNGSFRHWHTFDPARVKDLVISCGAGGEHAFELGRMYPLQEMNESLLGVMPFIDTYGQYKLRDWPDKVRSDADIRAGIEAESVLAESFAPAGDRNRFGGWANGPRLEATGFFRTERVDGRWWFVDPEGRLFWSFGVNCIGLDHAGQTPVQRDPAVFDHLPSKNDPAFGRFHVKLEVEENYLPRPNVPHYDFTRSNLFRKYGDDWEARQIEQDLRRLAYCDINTIGAWSDPDIVLHRKVPYVAMIHYGYPAAATKLPDPFDPKTRESLRASLQAYPIPFADDPWCLGAFINNELHWKNDARDLVAGILGTGRMGSEARKAFRDRLVEKYPSIEAFNAAWQTTLGSWNELLTGTDPSVYTQADRDDCAALATLFADTFFRMVREELSAHAPHILYLGCRMNAAPPEVIEALARHADVMSINLYAYRPNPGRYGATDKPVLISEFHFANVSGNNLGSGLRSAQDAEQQGRLFRAYLEEALRDPRIVGAHWYQWRDQSVGGRFDGENYDIGLFDVADQPNPKLIRAVAAVGSTLYSETSKPKGTP